LRGPVERSQYTSIDFNEILDDHGVLASIGSVGDAYDTQSRFPPSASPGPGLTLRTTCSLGMRWR
jgi:hypothetical protein